MSTVDIFQEQSRSNANTHILQ